MSLKRIALLGAVAASVAAGGIHAAGGLSALYQLMFKQGGTSAVSRTARSKVADFVSVMDFGATGNGVTNDTAAVTAAVAYAGDFVNTYFPCPGTYQTTTWGTIPCGYQELVPATGAVPRPLGLKVQEILSAKDFGAVGNGVTDDTTALGNLVNAASGTQLINLPCPGTYISSTYGTLVCGMYYPPLSATGAVLRSVPAKLLETISLSDFGAKGDGTTDDTTAIQNAISALPNGGKIIVPNGVYKITSPINLANLQQKPITIQGSARGECIYDTTPTQGASFYGLTGTQAMFETQGSHFVTFRDVCLFTHLADTNRSAIGIFIGRTTVQASAQFHKYENVFITMANKAGANAGRGSIGLEDIQGEHSSFDHMDIEADTPLELSDNNALSYVPTYGTLTSVTSTTLNTFHDIAFLSLSQQSLELRGIQSTSFIDCYYSAIGAIGNVAVAIAAGSNVVDDLLFWNGQVENYNHFMEVAPIDSRHIKIEMTWASPSGTGPLILEDVNNNQTFEDLDAHFTNHAGNAVTLIGTGLAGPVTGYGGHLSIGNGINQNQVGLTLIGTEIQDFGASPATVTLAAGSQYNLLTTAGFTVHSPMTGMSTQAAGSGVTDFTFDSINTRTSGSIFQIKNHGGNQLAVVNSGAGAFSTIQLGTKAVVLFGGTANTFATIGTPGDGTFTYCSDCDPASSPCTSAGAKTGAFAFHQGGAWKCL